MKISKMKQVVAGMALSAVMIGATAFNAHPVFAEKTEEVVPERGLGIYRAAKELTDNQKADLRWYQERKTAILKAGWQLDVDNGYMSKQEMEARMIAVQERYKRSLNIGVETKVLTEEEKDAAKRFVKKYQKATKQERQAMQLDKLQKEFDSKRISKNEFEARKFILQEEASRKQDKRAQSPEYRANKAKINKQLKQLNMEYLQKCRDNGSLTTEQYQRILDKLSKVQAKKTIKS